MRPIRRSDDPIGSTLVAPEARPASARASGETILSVSTVKTDPDAAAAEYRAPLRRDDGGAPGPSLGPLFHICLRGLGDDGHTASLPSGESVPDQPAARRTSVVRE